MTRGKDGSEAMRDDEELRPIKKPVHGSVFHIAEDNPRLREVADLVDRSKRLMDAGDGLERLMDRIVKLDTECNGSILTEGSLKILQNAETEISASLVNASYLQAIDAFAVAVRIGQEESPFGDPKRRATLAVRKAVQIIRKL